MTDTAATQYFVYILQCSADDYYVGCTSDVTARVQAHNDGHGPRYTACRRPISLVYTEPAASLEKARHREIQIKKWSRAKKGALIKGNMQ